MKFVSTFRMVANVVFSCALLFSVGAAAAQSPSGDVSDPSLIVLSPPSNPDWSINRVSSHWLTQDFPLNTNDSHSFAIDSQGHPHVVYGKDKLYYATDDGSGWKYQVVDDYRGGVSNASFAISTAPLMASWSPCKRQKYSYLPSEIRDHASAEKEANYS